MLPSLGLVFALASPFPNSQKALLVFLGDLLPHADISSAPFHNLLIFVSKCEQVLSARLAQSPQHHDQQ